MAQIYSLAAERRRRGLISRVPAPVVIPIGKQMGDSVRLHDGRSGIVTHVALAPGYCAGDEGEAALELVVLTSAGSIVTRANAVTPIERYCR